MIAHRPTHVLTSDKFGAGIFVDLSHVDDGPGLLSISKRKRTAKQQRLTEQKDKLPKETMKGLADEKNTSTGGEGGGGEGDRYQGD